MQKRLRLSILFITLGLLIGIFSTPKDKVLEVTSKDVSITGTEESPVQLPLNALCAVLMDGDSGRVLYGKEETTFRPMASTTKIMTCILALEYGNLEDLCTVSSTAASQPEVHLGASKGTSFYMNDLLYSLMLESHNDTAVMIAEQVSGSVEAFAELMNQKARDIGCTNTNFVTPNGLDSKKETNQGTEYYHGTTAEDLARIMRYCIMESPKKEEFIGITQTMSYYFTDSTGRYSYSCNNHNQLLTMIDGAISGKTGFTGGAGYSYVGAIEDEGRTFIIALLASGWPPNKTYKWNDAKKLFDYGKETFSYQDVYQEPNLPQIQVVDGVSETVSVELRLNDEEKTLPMLLSSTEKVKLTLELPDFLEAPIKADTRVGYLNYSLNDVNIKTYPIYVRESVEKKTYRFYFEEILEIFLSKISNKN